MYERKLKELEQEKRELERGMRELAASISAVVMPLMMQEVKPLLWLLGLTGKDGEGSCRVKHMELEVIARRVGVP